jgi:hypothetical protein
MRKFLNILRRASLNKFYKVKMFFILDLRKKLLSRYLSNV